MPPIRKKQREAIVSAGIHPMKNAAELKLAEQFLGAHKALPGSAEIAGLRSEAFRRFEAAGLPHRRVEAWHYTDLRSFLREAKPLADVPGEVAGSAVEAEARFLGEARFLADAGSRQLVFIDGRFVAGLSDLEALEPGLRLCPLSEALARADEPLLSQLGRILPVQDAMVDLNTALMSDGMIIHVAAGAKIERPLHLLFIAGAAPVASFARSLIIVERGAAATLVESYCNPAGSAGQVNAALELEVGEGAQVEHLKIIADDAASLHVSSLMAVLGAGARFSDFSLVSGGALVRNQLFLRFEGEGAQADIRGATLLNGRQHGDTSLVADHAAPRCESRQIFKTVLEDEARAAFQGKITVRPGAQKTNARMMAQALLLSDTAEADSKPELEIFADDVQCGHGATSGSLDRDLKFYLMARGIPAREAEALLIEAFAGEALDGIRHWGLREALGRRVTGWLAARRNAM